jgi:hypothetical protein
LGFFKNTLKKIFPKNFLQNVYRILKKTRVALIDPLLFPEYNISERDFLLYRKKFPFLENNVDISSITDERVHKYMQQWKEWTQEEFIFEFKGPLIIEPDHGWAIGPGRKLLYCSLGISRTWFLPKPAFFRYLFRRKTTSVKSLISFRDTGEQNYFHFFNDVVAKFFFLRAHNVSFDSRPVLISKKLFDQPYFQWYMKQAEWLRNMDMVVQGDEYIETSSALFCKPMTHRKDLIEAVFHPIIKTPAIERKIFVTRDASRMRHIGNNDEIVDLFRKHGFDIVDPDKLSSDQQREIFSGASFIAGIHGAALTNLYLRPGSSQVLEIFPPPEEGYLPFHYLMLAAMKGFKYEAVIGKGTKLNLRGGFDVDATSLDALVRRMLRRE